MAFDEVQFPRDISLGARGGPRRKTQIVALTSGHEERNASWFNSRRSYDVSYGVRTADALAAVVAFFEARNGMLHGFRFKDWSDYKSCAPLSTIAASDEQLGTGNGVRTEYQLVKRYGSGGRVWIRDITKPVAGTVIATVGGAAAPFTTDLTTGRITFDTAPAGGAEVRAGFEFDVPVRFDTDMIDVALAFEAQGAIASIPLIEVRQ